jgi:hypothetical protein
MVGHAVSEATGRQNRKRPKNDVSNRAAVVLGSGNLGPHIGWLLVRSVYDGPLVLGANGVRNLATGQVDGEDPLAAFSPTAPRHLLRTEGFPHVADIMVGSFYDPELESGCAFEELNSFHGGLAARRPARSSSTRRAFLRRPSRSSAPPCTPSSRVGAQC